MKPLRISNSIISFEIKKLNLKKVYFWQYSQQDLMVFFDFIVQLTYLFMLGEHSIILNRLIRNY